MRYSYANAVQGIESSNNVHTVVDEEDASSDKELSEKSKQNTVNLTVPMYNSDVVDSNLHSLYIHNSDHPG